MHPATERFLACTEAEYGLSVTPEEFPDGTKTAADAADAVGCSVEQIVKSIILVGDDSTPFLALTSGGNRVAEPAAGDRLGFDTVRSASPAEVKEATGWAIGGVPPICHDRDLQTLFDPTFTGYDRVWAAAGTPQSVFAIDPSRLETLTAATKAHVFESATP